MAECQRLFRKCAQGSTGNADIALEAFEMLFGLLREVDDGEEIVFFADEGGSYLLNPEWESVLPAYYACLVATNAPDDYAEKGHQGPQLRW